MSSLKAIATAGSFTLGIGLLLTACTIEVPESEDELSGGGSGGGGAETGTSANTGGSGGGTGTTSSPSAGGATTGASADPTSAAGGSSSAGGSGTGGSSATTGEGGASDGGTGGSASDNCPDDPSSDQTDTDSDGHGNVCDDDDDDDGFVDQDDPEPLDVDVPGDFSTPEKVLADPRMVEALEELRDAGFELETHLETDPPDVTGYLRKEENAGEFVANSGGGGVGVGIIGSESRTLLSDNGRLESARVSFAGGEPVSFSSVTGQTLRGTGNEFTIYRTSRGVCTESNSNHIRYSVAIESGTVDANGDHVNSLTLSLTVATRGELTSDCATRANGLTENENEWNASLVPLASKVEVSELEYMCVDGDAGYAPTETWSREAQACECSIEYAVACAAP